jgi:magnesium chelatase family protein
LSTAISLTPRLLNRAKSIKARVNAARAIQRKRFDGTGILFNAQMDSTHIKEFCTLDSEGEKLMEMAFFTA